MQPTHWTCKVQSEDQIPKEEEEVDAPNYHVAPHQMAAYRLRDAAVLQKIRAVVASHLMRRENAILRLQHTLQLRLDPILPTVDNAKAMYNAIPINTAVRQLAPQSTRDGLHVVPDTKYGATLTSTRTT